MKQPIIAFIAVLGVVGILLGWVSFAPPEAPTAAIEPESTAPVETEVADVAVEPGSDEVDDSDLPVSKQSETDANTSSAEPAKEPAKTEPVETSDAPTAEDPSEAEPAEISEAPVADEPSQSDPAEVSEAPVANETSQSEPAEVSEAPAAEEPSETEPTETSEAPVADEPSQSEPTAEEKADTVGEPNTSDKAMAPSEPEEETEKAAASADADQLLPHRAIYEITLTNANDRAGISNITGEMSFSFQDQCEGWTSENNSLLNIQYSQGPAISHRQSFVTWESKDGELYRFLVRRSMDGRPTDNIKGEANATPEGPSAAEFTSPEETSVELSQDVRFPIGFLRDLIAQARSGEVIVSHKVFEGDEIEPPYLVSAFITPMTGEPSTLIKEADLPGDVEAWKFRLAYFKPGSRSPEPEFELRLVYRSDGIADEIVQDFGDYALGFQLKELEILDKPAC